MEQISVFDVVPVPKPRMTRSDSWKKRPCVQRYWAFKDEILYRANLINFKLKNNMGYAFYLPMPKSWSKKVKAEKLNQLHDQKPDLDNLLKALWDCFGEDKEISSIAYTRKYWGDKGKIIIETI